MTIKILIAGHPPSVNNLFWTKGRRRIKTTEYREWETHVYASCLKRGELAKLKEFKGVPFKVRIDVFATTWHCKNGNMKRKDIDNFVKSTLDSICAVYGWEDHFAVEVLAAKRIGASEETLVSFEFLPLSSFRTLADL